MTAHTCKELTPGCYRCELNVDEMAGAFEAVTRDLEEARSKLHEIGLDDTSEEAMLAAREWINEIGDLHTERFELLIALSAARHKMGMS